MRTLERLGAEIVEFTPERAVMRTLVCEEMLQPDGILHGGMSAYLAESLASKAAGQYIDKETHHALGLELSSSHLLPVHPGDTVESTATPLSIGGRVQVWKIEQRRASDGELFNVSQLTVYIQKVKKS